MFIGYQYFVYFHAKTAHIEEGAKEGYKVYYISEEIFL